MSLKNNALATRKNYIRGVRALLLHYQKLPEDCTVDEIKSFLVRQRDERGFSSSTVNLRVCGLKYYFRYVVHRLDLVVKIPNPSIQKFDTEILTLEEIIEQFLPTLSPSKMPSEHRRTLEAIRDCRTAALGGHIDACDECGNLRISYNSCRNRHCPKCQGINKEMWLIQQEEMLLPVAYFHVVFTIPHELNQLCMHQPKFMYDLLFQTAWHTLNTLAMDSKCLGAKTAATMASHPFHGSLT